MAKQALHYRYVSISGRDRMSAGALGYRYRDEADFRSAKLESWLLYFKPAEPDSTATYLAGKWDTYVSGIWVSDSGRLYAALAQGALGIYDGVQSFNQVSMEKVSSALTGIWGLDDKHVFAYGGSPVHGGFVYFWNGKAWKELPRPPAWLVSMHGCAPDCVYGLGAASAYRWNGKTWSETALRAALSLSAIWVERPDELYATDEGGVLFEGSADGWIRRAEWEGPLSGVAKFKAQVWVGGNDQGLLRLDAKSNKIESFKPNIAARTFEAREQLLIPLAERISFSDDGQRFRSFGLDGLKDLASKKPYPF
jgi:hypothetical protein